MANIRQYIGARYVFKIYENSQDPSSAEWEANVTYEPFTIVTYLNSTYASKKDVPGSVGNPAANPQYWVITGAYNGQIATLQQQIDTINNTDLPNINSAIQTLTNEIAGLNVQFRINPWHNKNVVVYGDSLSTVEHEYWQYMTEYDGTINVTNRAVGGTRIQDGVTLLNAATDLNDFDIIVLAYGTNSWANTSMREMLNSYKEAFSIIANKAPTKEVIVIAPPYAHNDAYADNGETNSLRWHIADYANNICAIANMYGHKAYNLYQICGVNNFNYATFMEDSGSGVYVHQNELLGRRIAYALLNDSYYSSAAVTYTFISADGSSGTRGFMVNKQGNHIDIAQRGSITVTELEALDFNHIAPAPLSTSFFRDTNGNMGLATMSVDGVITLSWNSTVGTNVQGLHFSGMIGKYE